MLVRAVRGFIPATGGPVSPGDVFELPKGVDWLDCGLCVKAEAGAKAGDNAPEPQAQAGKPHQQLRNNVRDILIARHGDDYRPEMVEPAMKAELGKKKATQARIARRKAQA